MTDLRIDEHSTDEEVATFIAGMHERIRRSVVASTRRRWLRADRLWRFAALVHRTGVPGNGTLLSGDQVVAAFEAVQAEGFHVPVCWSHGRAENPDERTEYGVLTGISQSPHRVTVTGVSCVEPRRHQPVSLGVDFRRDSVQEIGGLSVPTDVRYFTELSLLGEGIAPGIPGARVLWFDEMDAHEVDTAKAAATTGATHG